MVDGVKLVSQMGEGRHCPLCGGKGFIITERGARKCRCIYGRFNLEKFLNIPKRFWDADIRKIKSNLCAETSRQIYTYLRGFKTFYDKGIGLLLIGKQGVGKTYIVTAILKYLYQKYRIRGLFTDTKELSIKLRERFEKGGHSDLVEVLARVPVLVLDDLGNEVLTDWYRDILVGLISQRYNEKKVTFVTTNFYPSFAVGGIETPSREGVKIVDRSAVRFSSLPQERLLDSRFGSHVVSRLGEMTIPIVVKGIDQRLKKVLY
ncbi:MAG TPA: ATP-binding protein [Aquifex aeolicus]|uniref:ATP-binding protein n=1 Tax=Aquifex aeolicus TaxID=63363 RepID=A0A9D1CFW6_AQUAO|nr:ATP-binding protein [Aquifex aeolicus]